MTKYWRNIKKDWTQAEVDLVLNHFLEGRPLRYIAKFIKRSQREVRELMGAIVTKDPNYRRVTRMAKRFYRQRPGGIEGLVGEVAYQSAVKRAVKMLIFCFALGFLIGALLMRLRFRCAVW